MNPRKPSRPGPDDSPAATIERRRRLQERPRAREAGGEGSGSGGEPVQAGDRPQPAEMPAQGLDQPGRESELDLAPRYMAPGYLGSSKLEDRVALITGGDSGIGRAVAVLFAREGADVCIVALSSEDDARETRRRVEEDGRRCEIVLGDVKDPAFCRDAVDRTIAAFGRLDVLVNNAAYQQHSDSLESLLDEQFEETVQTNLLGYVRMTRAALPHLGNGAAIINTGSVTGLEGSGKLLDYASTKGAIHAFTKSLAQNLLHRGIRVNAVAPGPVWTPLNPVDRPSEALPEFGKGTDMKRPAQPEEISPAYVYLASPVCSGYVTGVVLPITGSVAAI
jgi:NAD(P)-dependent dehydrogenase (short-subunit alcohol dehydrogenase family)